MQNMEETGTCIWLRYTTQMIKDGQTHTVEISLPVPIGASAEQREQLIHEAEAGMSQLVQHMGARLPQMFQRASSSAPASQPQIAGKTIAQPSSGSGVGVPVSTTPVPNPVTRPPIAQRPAAAPAPQTAPQSQSQQVPQSPSPAQQNQVRETRLAPEAVAKREEVYVPQTRPNIGASMPLTLGPTLDSSGNLPLPEFITYIKENLGLIPKQAMQMLNLKSLAGVNLREALDRLKVMVAQGNTGVPVPSVQPQVEPSRSQSNGQAHADQEDNDEVEEEEEREEKAEPRIIEMRVPSPPQTTAPTPGFDEEEGPDTFNDDEFEDETQENLALPREFTPQQLEQARLKIRELREHQGASTANAKRLQALSNVVDSQISQEQLQEIILGIWNVSTPRKLKVDQVEALISWAKQDDFIDDVEASLVLLEEERYARGNR